MPGTPTVAVAPCASHLSPRLDGAPSLCFMLPDTPSVLRTELDTQQVLSKCLWNG